MPLPNATDLAPGLTRWSTHYPAWGHDVACVALDSGDGLVLIDPLAPSPAGEARSFWQALDVRARAAAHVHVVLTLHYHLRSAPAVVARYRRRPGATLWATTATAALVGTPVDNRFDAGDALPAGIQTFRTGRDDEVAFWLPEARTLVTGDVLLGGVRKPYRICPASWLPRGVGRALVAEALEPLRSLPVEVLLPLHGPPVTEDARATLAAALDEARA